MNKDCECELLVCCPLCAPDRSDLWEGVYFLDTLRTLENRYPNDKELGEEVRRYIKSLKGKS